MWQHSHEVELLMQYDKRLHIYGSGDAHGPVYIVGDLSGLLALRKAVEEALNMNAGQAEFFAGDGEGFPVFVGRIDSSAEWDQLSLPYPVRGVPHSNAT